MTGGADRGGWRGAATTGGPTNGAPRRGRDRDLDSTDAAGSTVQPLLLRRWQWAQEKAEGGGGQRGSRPCCVARGHRPGARRGPRAVSAVCRPVGEEDKQLGLPLALHAGLLSFRFPAPRPPPCLSIWRGGAAALSRVAVVAVPLSIPVVARPGHTAASWTTTTMTTERLAGPCDTPEGTPLGGGCGCSSGADSGRLSSPCPSLLQCSQWGAVGHRGVAREDSSVPARWWCTAPLGPNAAPPFAG